MRSAWLLALALLASCREAPASRPPEQAKPELFLLTSLPIAWSEAFALDQPKSPVMEVLERDYRVRLVDLPSQLPKGALLLAAQPRALPAEELVKLDKWVRDGGRMVLLADPMLEWPSELPLGDRRRAPMALADTGLLQHWGLRLDAPEQRGLRSIRDGDIEVSYISPGELVRTGGECHVSSQGNFADCVIGKGHVQIVADSDWLNFDAVQKAGDRTQSNEFALMVLTSSLLTKEEAREFVKRHQDGRLTR